MVNGQRIDAEAHLKLRVLVKVVDTNLGQTSRLSSITSRVCSSDSLRIAEISVMTFSLTRLAICCSSAARLTLNGNLGDDELLALPSSPRPRRARAT